MELSTNRKGAIAETAIAAEALRLGIDVYRPVAEGGRYDLIFDMGPFLLRVQCKWAVRYGDVVIVRAQSSRRAAAGHIKRKYAPGEVDALAAYCHELKRAYLLPISLVASRSQLSLRLAPARNNQIEKLHWAAEYELGAIAQLGERRAGSAEAGGSSPPSSTVKAAHHGRLFS